MVSFPAICSALSKSRPCNYARGVPIKEAFASYASHKGIFEIESLNLVQLATFVDVVMLGSFSAAAVRQNVSQPAVSLQVRQLEKRLGVRLIERVGRRATPTAAGIVLLGHAARIKGEVEVALEAMARHASGGTGRVRLGTGATACIFLLPPLLRDLRRRFPALEIIVTTGNTPDILRAVEDNALDIALVSMPAAGRMLDITVVLEDEFVLVAPREAQLPQQMTPKALSGLPLILFEPSGNTRRLVDRWFAAKGVELHPTMALDSVEAIKELVAAGLGCAILPAMAIRDVERVDRFVVRLLAPKLHRELAVVLRKDKVLHRALREVAAALTGVSSPSAD